jgi:hypothetical protein
MGYPEQDVRWGTGRHQQDKKELARKNNEGKIVERKKRLETFAYQYMFNEEAEEENEVPLSINVMRRKM